MPNLPKDIDICLTISRRCTTTTHAPTCSLINDEKVTVLPEPVGLTARTDRARNHAARISAFSLC